MATNDPDKARSRFLNALHRITKGLEIQRSRIMEGSANAPKLLAGEYEVTDLTGDSGNDLDYYVYELARLQDLARTINDTFDRPQEVVDALTAFDAAIPNLRKIRNPLTHTSDDKRLDDVAWFDSLVKLKANGSVEYLVDPRYEHDAAAKKLSEALTAYLRVDGKLSQPG